MKTHNKELVALFAGLLILTTTVNGDGSKYWVDVTNGNDANPGTQDKPFKTITKARDTIRGVRNTTGIPEGGITVTIAPGDYDYTDGPLEFNDQDSGTAKSPIIYMGVAAGGSDPGKVVHLTAGKTVNWGELISPVTDSNIKSLLRNNQQSVVQVDLRKMGLTDFGDLGSGMLADCANNKVDFHSQSSDMIMTLARYPNIDSKTGLWQWLSAGKVIDKQKSFDFNTDSATTNKIRSWKNTSSLWLHGYWSYDWADNYISVEVSTNSTTFIASDKTPPVYGFIANARYYALNILEELDQENEYYIDRGSGILYLLESTARRLYAASQGCVSVGESVLTLDKVSFVQFEGFTIDCAKVAGVTATNANNLTFSNLVIQDTGGYGISVVGYNNSLTNVQVNRTGCGGIHVTGGDQKTLTRGNNIVKSSKTMYWSNWKRTYTPGVGWGGVGNSYIGNMIQGGPHVGLFGGGNDCLFEGNTLDTLCFESSDSGAFYTGRNWINRGNVIRGNTFKNIVNLEKTHLGAPSVQAIYLDDQMSGYTIENNVFINCHCGSFIGGGRRNTIRNNTYHNCGLCTHVDDRGLTWQKEFCSPGGDFEQGLNSVNYQHPPWSTHYPELVNIMKDHPCVPVYNTIVDNKCCQSEKFIDVSDDNLKKWMITVQNNTVNC